MQRLQAIILLGVLVASLAAGGREMRLEVKGLQNAKGDVLVSLFASKKGFPGDHKESFRSKTVKASTNGVSMVFTNLPAGTYAIAICHDENGDGKVNRRMFGPPVEGYAVYKKQKPRLGPPKFEKSAFNVSTSDLNIVVHLVYPGK